MSAILEEVFPPVQEKGDASSDKDPLQGFFFLNTCCLLPLTLTFPPRNSGLHAFFCFLLFIFRAPQFPVHFASQSLNPVPFWNQVGQGHPVCLLALFIYLLYWGGGLSCPVLQAGFDVQLLKPFAQLIMRAALFSFPFRVPTAKNSTNSFLSPCCLGTKVDSFFLCRKEISCYVCALFPSA